MSQAAPGNRDEELTTTTAATAIATVTATVTVPQFVVDPDLLSSAAVVVCETCFPPALFGKLAALLESQCTWPGCRTVLYHDLRTLLQAWQRDVGWRTQTCSYHQLPINCDEKADTFATSWAVDPGFHFWLYERDMSRPQSLISWAAGAAHGVAHGAAEEELMVTPEQLEEPYPSGTPIEAMEAFLPTDELMIWCGPRLVPMLSGSVTRARKYCVGKTARSRVCVSCVASVSLGFVAPQTVIDAPVPGRTPVATSAGGGVRSVRGQVRVRSSTAQTLI